MNTHDVITTYCYEREENSPFRETTAYETAADCATNRSAFEIPGC